MEQRLEVTTINTRQQTNPISKLSPALEQSFRGLHIVLLMLLLCSCSNSNWRTASREPAGIAVDPLIETDAVIEVYAADAFSWRGWFAVHTWIAVKNANESFYTVHEVIGWRVKNGLSALHSYQTTTPDRYWFGAKPEKILLLQGQQAATLIPRINAAITAYPWSNEYTLFPGPNSNTFTAWVGKQIPELQLHLPFSALGSGYVN